MMDDNEEPLMFTADSTSETDTCSTHEDNVSESGDTPHRRLATFSLSMSDFGDADDRNSNSTIDDDYMNDVAEFSDAQRTERMPYWRRETRLSRILGISADERCEKRLMLGEDPTLTLQQEMQNIQNALRPKQFDVGSENTEEFEFLDSGPIRRCISLKTSKTPPGTPRRKKEVRFADALGLDLESIRQILNQDDPPIVPDSAMKGLNLSGDDTWSYRTAKFMEQYVPPQRVRHLCACFAQPGYSPDFARRVEERRVSLEHCTVDDGLLTVSGTIRVANIAFEKQVIVRHTVNGWMTYADENAKYVSGGSDSTTDQFSFIVRLPDYFDFSSRMEFSVMYITNGQTYWDSNFGANYRIECHVEESPAAVRRCDAAPTLCSEESAVHPFY